MEKKTRAQRRREKLNRVSKLSFSQKVQPFLSFGHPVTRFCLFFLGLLITFYIPLTLQSIKNLFYTPVTTLIASQGAFILKVLGMNVYASGITISGEGFSVKILGNCNAILETVLFLSAVIAFPASLKEKVVGGILGTIFIYTLNLIRVVLLFLIGVYAPQHFEQSHIYVAQSIFIVLVAIFWLFWIEKGVKNISTQ
jgi:exosortase H (IPTLxxWG-CTERM-specific)